MSDETSNEDPQPFNPTWRLPDGIENHIESGLVKAAVGMTLGGVAGMMLFRPGGGYRIASIATGLGVALGSAYERYKY
eukprot:CAMPEP_0168754514 /NCGR_PEP_ID=MMETSP0724-20121128/19545_1 /TAXON_ID=265536 /ORGANISM="Amphiprora sp., Strain CCMP467" /LENGTH=77 /DNA_ID=CAMNT_0008803005 /DNA_START=30 /DNA_END=263 /DNA_ORIENTATION=+